MTEYIKRTRILKTEHFPALPTELHPYKLGMIGIEPMTRGLQDRSIRYFSCLVLFYQNIRNRITVSAPIPLEFLSLTSNRL